MRPSRSSSNASSTSTSSSSSQQEAETQQIFVKLLSGEIIPLTLPTSTTLPTLLQLLSLRTSAAPTSLRLVYAGKHLTAASPPSSPPSDQAHHTLQTTPTLSNLSIPPNATLHLALPLLGGMPPKKMKCNYLDCKEAAQRIVGDCSFCEGHFCQKHRMLENHHCKGLEDCKQEGRDRNKNTLEGERTSAIKGV